MPSLIKFEDTVSYRLAKVTTAFRNSLERHMAEIGLHGGQIFILIELWKQDGLRQIDLAKSLNVSAPTINKMLTGLTEIKLVTCAKLVDDGRSTRVFLTDLGREIRDDVEDQWRELEEKCLTGLTAGQREMFSEILGTLYSTYTGQTSEDDEE